MVTSLWFWLIVCICWFILWWLNRNTRNGTCKILCPCKLLDYIIRFLSSWWWIGIMISVSALDTIHLLECSLKTRCYLQLSLAHSVNSNSCRSRRKQQLFRRFVVFVSPGWWWIVCKLLTLIGSCVLQVLIVNWMSIVPSWRCSLSSSWCHGSVQ
jgi:hypothetical protein